MVNHSGQQVCRLCDEKTTLCNSHIIPEFFYRPMYDNMHRILQISTTMDSQVKFGQKGIREKLLCPKCEKYLNDEFEKYAKALFFGNGINIKCQKRDNVLFCSGVDYKRFKLFQMSVLWRASISSDPFFKDVQLGHHSEILKNMILNGDPGELYEYGCSILMPLASGKETIDIVSQPERFRFNGFINYRFIFGGYFWVYIVAKHAMSFSHKKLFLGKNGNLVIPIVTAEHTDFFKQMAGDMRLKEKDVRRLLKMPE